LIHGSDEILPAFLILAHQVFGPLQESSAVGLLNVTADGSIRLVRAKSVRRLTNPAKKRLVFVFDFGAKVLTMGAPKGLLCAVASQRRSAKWKRKARALDAVLRGSG